MPNGANHPSAQPVEDPFVAWDLQQQFGIRMWRQGQGLRLCSDLHLLDFVTRITGADEQLTG